jgi:N-acetylneuraminate synthase
MAPELKLGNRRVGADQPPLVIAEIGINHEGDIRKAIRMVDDAARAGCECEVPVARDRRRDDRTTSSRETRRSRSGDHGRCALTEEEERRLKAYVEEKGLVLRTPFSRAAADRLQSMNVPAYKIGSGEATTTRS